MEFLNGGYNWYYAKDYIVAHKKDMIQYCFYVFKNDLEITFSGNTYEVSAGDIMITSSGLPHTVSGKGEEYYIDWVIMSLDANDLHILQNLHLPLNTVLHIGNSLMLSNVILNCCYTAEFQKGDNSRTLHYLLQALIYCASSLIFQYENTNKDIISHPEMVQLRMQIYSEPEKEWNVELMSKIVHRSPSSLQQLYKRMFETTCNDDVIESRIVRAKALLRDTELPINDIAFKCGYNSYAHFFRQFRERIGVAPNEYRKG